MLQSVLAETDPSVKAFQEEREAMLSLFKATFDDVEQAVWITLPDGRPVYTNRAGARLLGEEYGGEPVCENIPVIDSMLEEVRQRACPSSRRAQLAGREFDALLSPLHDHRGRLVAALMTLRSDD